VDRAEIAAELLTNCPDESFKDHRTIAAAIRRGDDPTTIMSMPEVERWPETYSWLKYELSHITSPAAALGRKGGQAKSDRKTAASRANGKKGGRPKTKKEGNK
jgi:hypothetical protein